MVKELNSAECRKDEQVISKGKIKAIMKDTAVVQPIKVIFNSRVADSSRKQQRPIWR